ncbi:MAG: NADH-quinone oxidoreductase subunit NuoK [Sandaracinaceae bacterium]|jgi:NADH-quinone oxidoreductase subunit K|nr:NADH-quinone oxidoreductase subunit NuoK [Sandaracinaceae bacterium]MBP7681937.1 NADH-quinone oxidoreductase subunit NuoK [Deltaproteobacteria bacterium]MBK6809310.1 NADH-quinone oxidoreductase subunit NuoK [Sandaracinaceae bacterium]MBK7151344.1 NADH-quinone oxidoreductase subunit NuoK [Sandaracinaceae bacterium]MBK7778034.1 NADH-quinone oxidoreductase subunit NuoK [Sandaracinaceae bacterium]
MDVGIGEYLALCSVLFGIGAIGFLTRRNMLIQLMTIEVMLNSVVFMLLAFNRVHTGTQTGQVFGFFVIAIAAAEAAVGLAILISYFRIKNSVETDKADLLKH